MHNAEFAREALEELRRQFPSLNSSAEAAFDVLSGFIAKAAIAESSLSEEIEPSNRKTGYTAVFNAALAGRTTVPESSRHLMHMAIFPDGRASVSAIQRLYRVKWDEALAFMTLLYAQGWLEGLEKSPHIAISEQSKPMQGTDRIRAAWDRYRENKRLSDDDAFVFACGFISCMNEADVELQAQHVFDVLQTQVNLAAKVFKEKNESRPIAESLTRPGARKRVPETGSAEFTDEPRSDDDLIGKSILKALLTARDTAAAIDDPHTSLAQIVRWGNQLTADLRVLGAR